MAEQFRFRNYTHLLRSCCGLVRESPQNPLNSGLGIILICPEMYTP